MSSPPPPQSELHVTLETWMRPARVLAGVVVAVLSLGGTVAAAYYGATGAIERVAGSAAAAEAKAEQANASVVQLRSDTERQAREYQQATDARLAVMARERQEDRETQVRLEEKLKFIGSQVQDTRDDIRTLLERLNATPRARPRVAHDFPQ